MKEPTHPTFIRSVKLQKSSESLADECETMMARQQFEVMTSMLNKVKIKHRAGRSNWNSSRGLAADSDDGWPPGDR